MIERREFLSGVGASVVAITLAPRLTASGRAAAEALGLSRDRFLPLLNTWFDAGGGLSLELVSILDGPDVPEAEQFSLVFRGASTPTLASGTHSLWHGSLGHFSLHLERVGADAQQASYRADFNLLRG